MAEINIERKKKTRWPWILLWIILVLVVAWIIYKLTVEPGEHPIDQVFNMQIHLTYLLNSF